MQLVDQCKLRTVARSFGVCAILTAPTNACHIGDQGGEPLSGQWAQDDPYFVALVVCVTQNSANSSNCSPLMCDYGESEPFDDSVLAWYNSASLLQLDYSAVCAKRLIYAQQVALGSDISVPSDVEIGTPELPPFGESQWLDCELECQIYFGDRDVGEPCEHVGRRMSTCRESLLCGVDELCHEPCSLPMFGQLGDLCGFEVGAGPFPCADGLTCVQNRCAVDEPPVDPVDWCQVYIW